jgi:hypothetical protein
MGTEQGVVGPIRSLAGAVHIGGDPGRDCASLACCLDSTEARVAAHATAHTNKDPACRLAHTSFASCCVQPQTPA